MDKRTRLERNDKVRLIAFERDSILLKNATLGLLDGLSESPRFEAYYISPKRILSGQETSLSRPLNWARVNRLAKKDSLDLLISLDAANFEDTVYRRGDTKHTDLPKSYIIFPHLYWRFYNIRSKQVEQMVFVDTLYFPAGPKNGYPTKEKTLKLYYESLGDAGYRYSQRLAPFWKTEARAWYPIGDMYFVKAAELANDGNWKDASEIWRKMAYLDKRKVASKASFNMAVSAEMQDRLDLALMWVERAEELGLDFYPKHYKEILEERIKSRKILDTQMK